MIQRSAAATTSAARCRSFRTSPTKSRMSRGAGAGRRGDRRNRRHRSATSNRCPSSKPSARWAPRAARTSCFVHPHLRAVHPAAGEIKTKPTQHSVKELREIGIQPDILLCRMPTAAGSDERRKIALFCNVIQGRDRLLRRRFHLQDSAHAARARHRRYRLPKTCRSSLRRADRRSGTGGCRRHRES